MLKDLARALSLANLCFLAYWSALLDTTDNIPSFNQYFVIVINVVLVAALFWIANALARRFGGGLGVRSARFFFPLVLLVPLNAVIRILLPDHLFATELVLIAIAIVIISLSDIKPWNSIIVRSASTVTLVLLPFCAITLFQACFALTKFSEKQLAKPLTSKATVAPRVLWLVFDEMDQQIAFSERPQSLQLPELDRLRAEAIYASNAYPPADHTMLSMPALVTGKVVSAAKLVNPSELMITFADSQHPVSWGSQPNLFSKAREAGFNTAVMGWYLPYCRILGQSITRCYSQDYDSVALRQSLITPIKSLINTTPLISLLAPQIGIVSVDANQRRERQTHLDTYTRAVEHARDLAVDPNLGLILMHWPVPHPPSIYNRRRDDFEVDGENSYVDNFLLVDRALRDLRQAMEAADMWDDAIVLVTSDHWWRDDVWRTTYSWTSEDRELAQGGNDHRIPFVLKLANQRHTVQYDAEFNTILTHDLLLALLTRELSGPQSVMEWLNRHRSTTEGPRAL